MINDHYCDCDGKKKTQKFLRRPRLDLKKQFIVQIDICKKKITHRKEFDY